MNLAELRAAVQERTGVDYGVNALNSVINEALADIANEGDWPWLETEATFDTVQGTEGYALPASYSRTRVVAMNGETIDARSPRDFENDASSEGFTVRGNNLVLAPVPSRVATVTHVYFQAEPPLIADTDTPLLPAQYHPAVVNYAASIVLERVGEFKKSERRKDAYDEWLKKTKKGAMRALGPKRIRVRPGSVW